MIYFICALLRVCPIAACPKAVCPFVCHTFQILQVIFYELQSILVKILYVSDFKASNTWYIKVNN